MLIAQHHYAYTLNDISEKMNLGSYSSGLSANIRTLNHIKNCREYEKLYSCCLAALHNYLFYYK